MYNINLPLFWVTLAIIGALAVGTCVRIVTLRGQANELAQSRLASLRTWWLIAIVVTLAVLGGRLGIGLLLTVVSTLALKEYWPLAGLKSLSRPLTTLIFAMTALYYLALTGCDARWVTSLAPAFFFVVIGSARALSGVTHQYIQSTAASIWGLLIFVYGLSHLYLLLELPGNFVPPAGEVGWVLFLLLLTETNDITQAIVGRSLGRTKITPRVSPNKSLEGLLGGLCVTVIVALVSAPWLTSFAMSGSLGRGIALSGTAGILISLTGFLGDINMSGIKRDAGVKDGSRLLPGQGGMIDRIDSLTFSAPSFFYFTCVFQSN